MIEKNEKHCPYCGGRSPLGTPCSATCEENHARYRKREKLWKINTGGTVVLCFLYLLWERRVPGLMTAVAALWVIYLCVASIVFPYSVRISACEKKTERRMRTVGIVALCVFGVLCGLLLLLGTLGFAEVLLRWLA